MPKRKPPETEQERQERTAQLERDIEAWRHEHDTEAKKRRNLMAKELEEKTFTTQEGPRNNPSGKPTQEDREPKPDLTKPEKK